MQLVGNIAVRTLIWLTAALVPVEGLHFGSCAGACEGPRAAKAVAADGAHGPAAPARACCHARKAPPPVRTCCQAKRAPGCEPACQCGPACHCAHGKPANPPATPAPEGPSGKDLACAVALATGHAADSAGHGPQAHAACWSCASGPATSLERLSVLCRFLI